MVFYQLTYSPWPAFVKPRWVPEYVNELFDRRRQRLLQCRAFEHGKLKRMG
jgi:hypothetical protein